MKEIYRADHLGSLLRPPEILEARRRAAEVPEQRHALKELEDRHILNVLSRQKDLGFHIFTDGELRRNTFMSDFIDAVDGFDTADEIARTWQGDEDDQPAVSSITGIVTRKLTPHRRLTSREVEFLKQHAPGNIKITLPSATQFPAIAFKDGITDRVYPDRVALLWDIVEIMKAELAKLTAEGVSYIQIDAPRYSYYLDPLWREWIRKEMHREPDDLLAESLRADNECLKAARAAGVTLGFHLCRGNNRSQWYSQGGYDAVAEQMFNTLQTDRWLLEYDDERSGTFEPLRFIPAGATVVLGLISSKTPRLEDSDVLARRVEEASRYVPLENLALSPQCGFASTAEGNLLTEDEQWAKLQLVADTPAQIWK